MVGSGFRETRRRGSACVVSARNLARDVLNRFRPQGIGQDDPKQYPDCMHDASYKLLFSHAEMIKDLLQGFVPQSWVQALDFSTLEKVNASYVADDLRNRHDDVVWRVRFQDHWLYVYLLLEFQSTVDRFMAVRILSYTGLLYQDLIRGQSLHQDRLPPVLPIVLYNGEPRWKAAVELSALIHPAPQELRNPNNATCCWMKALTANKRWPGYAIWSRRSSAWRTTAAPKTCWPWSRPCWTGFKIRNRPACAGPSPSGFNG